MLKDKIFTMAVIAGASALVALPVQAQDLSEYEDDAPIALSGTVQDIDGDEFSLNYGQGVVTVEMEDWDWFGNEAEALIPGEQVTVTGWIDDDLFEGREIEAETVYVTDRYTYYYGEEITDPDYYVYSYMGNVPEGNWVSMTGTVKNVSGQQFTIENKSGDIAVSVSEMNNNPLDEEGLQRISEGDRVYVSGILDNEFFDNREIDASTVITLSKQQRRQTEGQTPPAEGRG